MAGTNVQRPMRVALRCAAALMLLVAVGYRTTAPLAAQLRTVPVTARSAEGAESSTAPVELIVGQSAVLEVGTPIARVSLTSPDVADALVTSSSQLLLNGKSPGAISMFVWDRGGALRRYDIAVQHDLTRLSQQVQELFPRERIAVHSTGRKIVLSGTVSSKEVGDRAVNVASGFVEKAEEVVSLLQVQAPRTDQVLLRVRFAEVSRSALTEVGASFFTSATGIENTLGRVGTQQFPSAGFEDLAWSKNSNDFGAPVTSAEGKLTFSDFLNVFLLSQKYDLGLLVKALQTRGLFESLAEPNLVAESGKEASFLAGGEFPIPVAQGSGANIGVSVQFKEFGVRLGFTPTVNGDRVRLKVRPEVSTLDFANAVLLQGFRIPALTTRRTETEIELLDGQTFAIAGLLNNSMTETMQKIPGIGDIPILGYLFKSRAARKERTELVVMITPQILRANSPGVTSELPALKEPFLSPLSQKESIAPPPPAFAPAPPASGASVAPAAPAASVAPAAPAAAAAPAPAPAPVIATSPTKAERQALERQRKEEREQAAAAARAAAAAEKAAVRKAEEDRRAQQREAERQQRLAREQAERDAKAAQTAAKEARRQAALEKERQQAISDAERKVKAAEAAYAAEVAKGGTR